MACISLQPANCKSPAAVPRPLAWPRGILEYDPGAFIYQISRARTGWNLRVIHTEQNLKSEIKNGQ